MTKENVKYCADLHLHTIYSDGISTPAEVVKRADLHGLNAIAITDHDCVEGIDEAMEEAREFGIEIIPGIELSSVCVDKEVHILAYFLDRHSKTLAKKFEELKKERVNRVVKMIDLLAERGMHIDKNELINEIKDGTIGRPHLARKMVEKGYVPNTKEAFKKYLANDKSCFVPHKRFEYHEAINMLEDAGGVTVLAHPALYGLDEIIPRLVEAGLKGIEVYHTDHTRRDSEKYLNIAREFSIIATGGSDCHGGGKGTGKILMGKVKVGRDVVEELRRESSRIINHRHENRK